MNTSNCQTVVGTAAAKKAYKYSISRVQAEHSRRVQINDHRQTSQEYDYEAVCKTTPVGMLITLVVH